MVMERVKCSSIHYRHRIAVTVTVTDTDTDTDTNNEADSIDSSLSLYAVTQLAVIAHGNSS